MSVLPVELEQIVAEIEREQEPLADYDVAAAIEKEVKAVKDQGRPLSMELQAEHMAFEFCEDYKSDRTGWGTFYGPMMVVPKGDKAYEWPSIQAVTPETLDYWAARSVEASHPVMKARYADLVCDLSIAVRKVRAEITCFQNAVDSYTAAIEGNLYDRSEAVTYADRALTLAQSINDQQRVQRVVDAILYLDEENAPDDDGAGIAFDLLVGRKNVPLTDEQRAKLVKGQESILARGVENAEREAGFPFSVDHAADRLAVFYRSQQQHDDKKRVLGLWARAKIAMARRASAMLGAAWLRDVYAKLNEFDCHNIAEGVAIVLRELSADSVGQMVQHTETLEISKEELDGWADQLLAGPLEHALRRVTIEFLPDPTEIERQVKELMGKAPLMSMLNITQVDSAGRQVARVGSVEHDLEGRVLLQMSQNIQFEAPFLRHAWSELQTRHGLTVDRLWEELKKSPIIDADRENAMKRALAAALDGDHMVAAHLLIPQIEHTLRRLAVMTGGSGYRLDRRTGAIQLKVLGDLLSEDGVVKALDARGTTYLKVVLSDPRGWNLRNDLCHGILDPQNLGAASTDRLLHVLLLLGSLRRADPSEKPTDSAEPPGK